MTGLIIDNFAGGGGASTALEVAMGRKVDIAINHDSKALAMHAANHPETRHLLSDVFEVDPAEVCAGRPIDVAWFSPDCTHFSRAKGRAPRSQKRRGLAWVVLRWASLPRWQRPRVIFLENVEEFETWCPLRKDGQPDMTRKGETFRLWVSHLQALGYEVEWQSLWACDYGAPTIRKRLFLVARCDGEPIVWPAPTHADPNAPRPPGLRVKLEPWKTAADVIDWSIPCPSIFGRKRPLAENTLRRIARGIQRYVIDNPSPFLVRVTQASSLAPMPVNEPLRTITTAKGGEMALVTPSLVQTGYGKRPGQAPRSLNLHEPLGTIVAGGQKHALVAAFLAQFNNDRAGPNPGNAADRPLSTVATRGPHQAVTAAHLVPTASDGDAHVAEVQAFLLKYYGNEREGVDLGEPLHTVTTKDRFGLVMVRGEPFQIVDIGLRMLKPRELFGGQGFPEDYQIEVKHEGRSLTIADQVRMVGNSVSPPPATALAVANAPLFSRLATRRRA